MAALSRVCVVGSLNIDYFTSVKKFPRPGETVEAPQSEIRFGGKGANQALAAARQGAQSALIGCVGSDDIAPAYLTRLREDGVDVDAVTRVDQMTGAAFITANAKGDSTIVQSRGANGGLRAEDVARQAHLIEGAGALLLQFEVPLEAVRQAISIAQAAEVPVIINPTPFRRDFPWGAMPLDYVIVNEVEFESLLGEEDGIRVRMKQLKISHLILTRGPMNTQVFTPDGEFSVPAMDVTPVDTLGAGDAFAGTFAARFVQGEELEEAVKRANIAAALTTQGVGAQDPIPSKVKVNAY